MTLSGEGSYASLAMARHSETASASGSRPVTSLGDSARTGTWDISE